MSDLRVTDVDTHLVACPTRPWLFVRVHTNKGITGLGEAMAHRKPWSVATAIDEMSDRYVIGEDPFQTERLFLEMYRDEWFSKNVINTTVISALDIALWDIKGKWLEMPIHEMLGGKVNGEKLRAYANGWFTDAHSSPTELGDAACDVVDAGYDALKFDPFGSAWQRMTRAELNEAVEKVSAVRDAIGPDIDLLIEGHGRFTPGMAIEVAEAIKPHDITWFEEPTPADNWDGLRKVAEKSSIPIASGERAMTKFDVRNLLTETDIDILQTDLANTGGITEGKKVAAMAAAEHVSFAPHNSQGPVGTAVCAHVCATAPNFMIQEAFEEYDVEWKTALLKKPLEISNGTIRVPTSPGLGVELDMEVVEEHAYEQNQETVDMVNPYEDGWENRSLSNDQKT